jgi:phosphoribosylformylglycinamidine synthase
MLARIHVTLKPGVNDPQGLAIAGGLRQLGFSGVEGVRAGRYLEVRLSAPDRAAAERAVEEMCQRLLANPVIERYDYEVTEGDSPAVEAEIEEQIEETVEEEA